MLGEVHCTAGIWVAGDDVSEHTMEAEAREWLHSEAQRRGQQLELRAEGK